MAKKLALDDIEIEWTAEREEIQAKLAEAARRQGHADGLLDSPRVYNNASAAEQFTYAEGFLKGSLERHEAKQRAKAKRAR